MTEMDELRDTVKDVLQGIKETDRILKESIAAAEKRSSDFDRRQKEYDQKFGSWSNNFGAFAEEYFFNSFENGKRDFFGEKYDRIEKNAKPLDWVIQDEYDFVFVNGQSVTIVETKFKAHENDLPKVKRKAETFRVNYPNYQNHRIYLGLASMAFYPELEEKCKKEGIAIVKQDGDNVVINYDNLKAF